MNGPNFTAKIASVKRLANSASGNPSWLITFMDGRQFKTVNDSDVNYGIDQPINFTAPVQVWIHAGRILNMKLVPE